MSAAANDFRARLRFFEVHFWPHQGRVLVINADPGQPLVITDLRAETSGADRGDATMLVAYAIAAAGKPEGVLVEHWDDGRVWQVDTSPGMARVPYAVRSE